MNNFALLFLLALLLLFVVPAWWVIVYLFVGPDIRYVKQDITVNGDVHVTNQAPAASNQFVGGKALAANTPREISVGRPARMLPSGGQTIPVLPERRQLAERHIGVRK